MLDRFDLHVDVPRLNEEEYGEITDHRKENSQNIRLRVEQAVMFQKERFDPDTFTYNGQFGHKQVKQFCNIDEKSRQLLVKAICQFGLSARSHDRLLRVARTIADLDASDQIETQHVAEALKYRVRREQQEPGKTLHAATL